MSTYTDLHNRIKETITVDSLTRLTPQRVNFVNPENVYHGKFVGEIHPTGNTIIDGGIIGNVVLSNSILDNVSFKNGMKIDDIKQYIIDLQTGLNDEILDRMQADCQLSVELTEIIDDVSVGLENEISDRMSSDNLLSVELTEIIDDVSVGLENEISNRISADDELERTVNDKMLHDRHFEMHLFDNREFPLKLHDFAINTYINKCANAYVYLDDDETSNPIGCITNTRTENGEITSFVFNAYADHPATNDLTAAGIFTYNFSKTTTTLPTGVGNFAISYEAETMTTVNNMRFVIDIISTEESDDNNALISIAKTSKKDTIILIVPDKAEQIPNDYKTASSKFIINFKVSSESLQDSSFVQLDLVSKQYDNELVDKFYYCNKEVCRIFISKNKWSTLKFEEIRPHRYIITDLDNSEIDWRIESLRKRLEADEISVASDINVLSADVLELSSDLSVAIRRNRDDVSFFGDVTLSDCYNEHDVHNHLSDLIATNEDTVGKVQYGFMYRCKAPVGRENEQFGIWIDGTTISAMLKDNMYFVVNKQPKGCTIPLNELKYSDVAFFNNFDIDVANLSAYARQIELSAAEISSEVSRLCSEISNDVVAKHEKLVADDSFISVEVSRLCTEISNDLTAKYEKLANDSIFISGEVGRLCTEISNDVTTKYSWLSGEVKSNDDDIKYLSSELSDYHYTLSGIDRKKHGYESHISSDNLIVTDLNPTGEGIHDRYYMTIDYGTIVMRKI